MIEVVINYDKDNGVFKAYEPTTDTLLITASLTESFVKLSNFLKEKGLIASDILASQDVSYHIDSATFIAMVESNVNLMKRLNMAPSGFMISSQRFGVSQYQPSLSQQIQNKKASGNGSFQGGGKGKKTKNYSSSGFGGSSFFSKSSFRSSDKKFGK